MVCPECGGRGVNRAGNATCRACDSTGRADVYHANRLRRAAREGAEIKEFMRASADIADPPQHSAREAETEKWIKSLEDKLERARQGNVDLSARNKDLHSAAHRGQDKIKALEAEVAAEQAISNSLRAARAGLQEDLCQAGAKIAELEKRNAAQVQMLEGQRADFNEERRERYEYLAKVEKELEIANANYRAASNEIVRRFREDKGPALALAELRLKAVAKLLAQYRRVRYLRGKAHELESCIEPCTEELNADYEGEKV